MLLARGKLALLARKTWMPGTRPAMTAERPGIGAART